MSAAVPGAVAREWNLTRPLFGAREQAGFGVNLPPLAEGRGARRIGTQKRVRALPPETVRRIGLILVDALRAAHRQGIVHRDVKPSNCSSSEDDRVLLTDLGIVTYDAFAALRALLNSCRACGVQKFCRQRRCRAAHQHHGPTECCSGLGAHRCVVANA